MLSHILHEMDNVHIFNLLKYAILNYGESREKINIQFDIMTDRKFLLERVRSNMPFEFHNIRRLEHSAAWLRETRWKKQIFLDTFVAVEDSGEAGTIPPVTLEGSFPFARGDFWPGDNKWMWLEKTVAIPEDFTNSRIWGRFDFGRGISPNGAFEGLLYVNGTAWQGLDENHQEVLLPVKAGECLHLQIRLWSGMLDGNPAENIHQYHMASLAVLDEGMDRLYYWLVNLLGVVRELEDTNQQKSQLLNLALAAWDMVDTSRPGTEDMYRSAAQAADFLESHLPERNNADVSVSMIGHTHIDTAWLWRLQHTREKCARSFSTVNRLMEQYPEYIFLHTQAQQYDWLKKDYPQIYAAIQERVKEARWEPAGGMWVECDCNLPSGESIVRQILYGTRFFEQEFGHKSTFLWLPDVFGYSAALPQILKKSGIDTFITTKISWNDQNRLPYDTFQWRGLDGTQILAHFITTATPDSPAFYTYSGYPDAFGIKGLWNNYRNKDLNTDLLMAYGYGDGGGGVNRDMLEHMRRLSRIPGMPTLKTEQVGTYCDRLHQTVRENPKGGYVPTWDGELYLEFHRGTYTSQAYNKKMNRRMEFLLRDTEMAMASAMAAGRNVTKEKNRLNSVWKDILTLQFHDIIPGSSIREVYEDSDAMYHTAETEANSILESTLATQTGLTLWNTANWARRSAVLLPAAPAGQSYVLENGFRPQQQLTANGKRTVILVDIAALYTEKFSLEDRADEDLPCATVESNSLETSFLSLAWNKAGQLTRIFDKRCGRELLPENKAGNALIMYEDRPRMYDAWELESTYQRKAVILNSTAQVTVEENGPVRTVIRFEKAFGNSSLTQRMVVYGHTARIDFQTTVDWQEREMVLRAEFPTNIRSTKARFDTQFGSLERATTCNTSWEFAQYEVVGHKWADFSETGYGAALLNDSKYGYRVKDGILGLTLLKASNYPDPKADAGIQNFTYALYPHPGTWYEADVDGEAWELNEPLQVLAGYMPAQQILELDDNGVTLDAVKPAEEGNALILRLHEKQGRRAAITGKFLCQLNSWAECDMLERNLTNLHTENNLLLEFTPFEVKTIRVEL